MRLISYNIHKGVGGRDRRYRLKRIIDVIKAENADLICLQEVDRRMRQGRLDDQAEALAEALSVAESHYQLNVSWKRGGGYGNLLLSRWRLHHAHQISLRLRKRKPRGAQLALVETPEGPLLLVHWHLGLGERERHWQVSRLLEHADYRDSAHLPTLVVGDFNDWRKTLARGAFARQGFHQLTSPRIRFRSFPANFPMLSLDKAFARGPVEVRHVRLVHSALTRMASDHLPLVVDFHLSDAHHSQVLTNKAP
ncbi:MAG: endonuclease/exonuclease/phosphatase family protein [Isosphaeraceae bacterium]